MKWLTNTRLLMAIAIFSLALWLLMRPGRLNLTEAGRPVDMVEIDQSMTESDLVLVKFGATWCGPCRDIERELDSLKPESLSIKIVKIDVDERPDLAQKYGIQGIPHVMLVKGGKSLEEIKGYMNASELTKWIQRNR